LARLVTDYGVDGFKLDGADFKFYAGDVLSQENISPNEHARRYAQFGLEYPLNEYRAMWKMGGQPLAQRLLDKHHSWDHLRQLIPHMIAEGLAGYAFSCPDMIGGGMLHTFEQAETIDQELMVRSAQCHALMPMMQFSVAPWRILDTLHMQSIKAAVDLRMEFTPRILSLARESAMSGEPILRNLEYNYPHQGYESIQGQFMMGTDLLVAPMVRSQQTTRQVVLPPGKWRADDGKVYKGGKTYTIEVPLERLPYFERTR